MLNPSGAVSIPITTFGGLNNELDPTDLPLGLSPDCRNVAFLPGQVFTRPSLQRLSTLGTTAQVIYTHSFPKRDGTIVKMDFDSLGGIWANGVKIGSTAAGNRFFCANANGRTYIAVSDGKQGTDVPLQFDGTNLDRVSQDGPGAPPAVTNHTVATSSETSLVRASGVVTATTTTPHGMQPGSNFLLSGVPAENVGTVSSIVIDNANTPGVATVTTTTPHGLIPQSVVTLTNVPYVEVGGGMQKSVVKNDVQTIYTNTPHGLQAGAMVMLNFASVDTINRYGPFTVDTVPSTTTFTFVTNGTDGTDAAGGHVYETFPQSSDPTGNQYTVSEVPTANTFQIPINYSNGTWTSGTLTFAWNGTFYVATVPSTTTFTYSQAGPDGTATATGTVTPQGQIAPGNRGVALLFETETGFITGPSPTVTWVADGEQQAQVTNIAIGPANVISRIVIFTVANGAKYFYLPVAPRDPTGGFLIGTSTVILDNVTTSAVFDFTDEALEAGIGVDDPGNNVFQQVVLAGCLGFYAYQGRLVAWGERNKVQNFLNMGFEGGVLSTALNIPLGWTVTGTGSLVPGDYGYAWSPTAGAVISQSAYQDSVGVARLEGNTQYTFRCWANGSVTATISSVSTGFNAMATVTASSAQGQANFSATNPAVIPSDLTISFAGAPMDELEIIYTANPVNLGARASYEDNFEAFDDVTGRFGPSDDPNPITGMVALDGVLSMLTNGPKGNHYRVEDSTSGEPATWSIRRHGEKCGVISVWGIASFETWFCWASDTGLRMFYGADVEKMSQEIQALWDSINPAAKQLTVLGNDPYQRRLHILAPTGTASVCNAWWVMDYRELNTSQALANSGTLRVVSTGKVITTDLTRKWCPWSVPMHYCTILQQQDGSAVMAFCGGTGASLTDAAHSAVYTLAEGSSANLGIDADYGAFWQNCYYTTAFVPEVETAAQLQLKPYRQLFAYLVQNVEGVGAIQNKMLLGGLGVTGTVTRAVPITLNLARDRAFGLNDATERLAVRFSALPATGGTLAGFAVSSLVLSALTHPYSQVSGWNRA